MDAARYAVVGAGLAGASTAWHLARRGHDVVLLERSRPAAHDGSSHGSARILRYAYPDQLYVDLVVRARTLWSELEATSGRTLLTPTDALDVGELREPRLLAEVLARAGVPHELVPVAEARERWPGVAADTEVLRHDGAVLDAEQTVLAMVGLAQQHGAEVRTGFDVERVTREGSGFRLHSADGQVLDAEHVVVSAGGWLPALLRDLPLPSGFLGRIPPLTVRQEQAYHFPYREPALWPTLIHKSPAISVYSLPGGRDADFRGQKVAEYAAGPVIPSARDQDGRIDPANRARVTDYVREHLPGLEPEPYAETTCLFTSTPTEDFVIDEVDGLTLLSPCSGHGAKFAPLLGGLAADVATGEGGIERFRLSRLPARA
ncbi:sarcosine oxidase [Motilibacter rhizosphaerae]|uniref:Sarcosine oxidase n=1 Tax=Motilibacter rhizosphaerae TaxID=598652 RepID=A0A4Q7N7A9_9ACTN|nr:FAD-dependent oxidoreductase [Motilibacter rhizosphaerae]RZS77568.1 sarcosine oxidase [Motilibacter rhizosphaerae]